MKLAQRIVLAYYKKKFRVLSIVSPKRAARIAFALFCTPYTPKRKRNLLLITPGGQRIEWMLYGNKVVGHQWRAAKNSNGKTILICHGFDSSSARFNEYIGGLTHAGFTVLAFDAPAHGNSSGSIITVLLYADLIERILIHYGPLHGIICHSFGGLATVLALERFETPVCQYLVMVSPSTETISAIEQFLKFLSIPNTVKTHFYQLIETLSGKHPTWFSVARAIEQLSVKTLWIHDKMDNVTPFKDVEPVLQKAPTHISFSITEGLGHSPYRNKDVMQKIFQFVSAHI